MIMEIETGKSLDEVTIKYNTEFRTTKSESSILRRYQSLLLIKKEFDKVRLSLLLFQYIAPSNCDVGWSGEYPM